MELTSGKRPRFSLRLLFIAVAALALVLAVGIPIYRTYALRVSKEEFARLEMGMTKEQVVELFGEPHVRAKPTLREDDSEGKYYEEWTYREWLSDNERTIWFATDGRVSAWFTEFEQAF